MECPGASPTTISSQVNEEGTNLHKIAIAKFFDGEGPDLLAEAQAAHANIPPPSSSRQTQNLQADLLASSSSRPRSPPHNPNLATRIETQPASEQQASIRLPFLIGLIFTPLNILYRLLSSSYHLFATLFPFLPRLGGPASSTRAGGAGSSSTRNTSGRRPLNPKDTAARFIREFDEEYNPSPTQSLPFLENGYNRALELAHRDLKFLLVVLISPEHDDTEAYVKNTLLSSKVTSFVNNPDNDILLWAGDVRDSEAYQVSTSLTCTKFPFAALIVHTPKDSPSAMSIVARLAGPMSPESFITTLQTTIEQCRAPLDRVKSTRREAAAQRNLRQEQESAYERSLAKDREKARLRREEEARKAAEEKEKREKEEAKERLERNIRAWKNMRLRTLDMEECTDKDAIRVSIRWPNGERVVRKFPASAPIEELYAFVECYPLFKARQEDEDEEAVQSMEKEAAPEDGYVHRFGFNLVSPMPRQVFAVEEGGSVAERIGRGGNLLVEMIDEDDEEEDEDDEGSEE